MMPAGGWAFMFAVVNGTIALVKMAEGGQFIGYLNATMIALMWSYTTRSTHKRIDNWGDSA